MGAHKDNIKASMKMELLQQFKNRSAKAGENLPYDWLYEIFLPSLSKKEMRALEEVLAEMIHDGIIAYVKGHRPTYRLTETGEQVIDKIC